MNISTKTSVSFCIFFQSLKEHRLGIPCKFLHQKWRSPSITFAVWQSFGVSWGQGTLRDGQIARLQPFQSIPHAKSSQSFILFSSIVDTALNFAPYIMLKIGNKNLGERFRTLNFSAHGPIPRLIFGFE